MPNARKPAPAARKSRLHKVQHGGQVMWYNLSSPDQASLNETKALLPFLHDEDLQDCLPPFQRPKLLRREQYLFMVLLFPVIDDATGLFAPYEVDFFIGKDFIITSHRGTHPQVTALRDACASDDGVCAVVRDQTSLHLALDVIHGLTVASFPMLTQLSNDLNVLERRLFDDKDDDLSREMLRARTSVVGFRKAVQGAETVLHKLAAKGHDLFAIDGHRAMIDDIVGHIREIREFLDHDRDTANALYDAHMSQATFRSGEAVKTLTALAGIVLPMTLVCAIFTLHTDSVPFAHLEHGWWIMMAFVFGTMLAVVLWMRKKRWL